MGLDILLESGVKLVLFGGKGGVGKTTCANSFALYAAEKKGLKTLVVSTDPAHSLTDSLDMPYEKGLTIRVEDNLYAVQLDPQQGMWDQLYMMNLSARKAMADPSFSESCMEVFSIDDKKISEVIKQTSADKQAATFSLILNNGDIEDSKELIVYAKEKSGPLVGRINNPNFKESHAIATLIVAERDEELAENLSKVILESLPPNYENVSLGPGQMEMHSFEVIYNFVKSFDSGISDYDLVVIDTAPTGHTLQLLEVPFLIEDTIVGWGVKGKMGLSQAKNKIKSMFGKGDPQKKGQIKALNRFVDEIKFIKEWLVDPSRVYFVPVSEPTVMSFEETHDLISRLTEFDIGPYKVIPPEPYGPLSMEIYEIDFPKYLVINRVLNEQTVGMMKELGVEQVPSSDCGFCEALYSENDRMVTISYKEYPFTNITVLVPDFPFEVKGLERLRIFSHALMEGEKIYSEEYMENIEKYGEDTNGA